MDNATELYCFSKTHKENDIIVSVSLGMHNVLELSNNCKCLLDKETKSTDCCCETRSNSFSEDCGFPGFSIYENKGFCKSETFTKYRYFSQFLRGASGNSLELTCEREQDSIDGVEFYSYETEDDMISSIHGSTSLGLESDDYLALDEESISMLNLSSMEYTTNTNNMKEIGSRIDVFPRSSVTLNSIECDEGFYATDIPNIYNSDSDLLNDYLVSYNVEQVCNESSNSTGNVVNNDHIILDLSYVADQERISTNKNMYEYSDYSLQNSTRKTEHGKDSIFVFEICDAGVNDERMFLCNVEDNSKYIDQTKYLDLNETENYIWNELNPELLSNYSYNYPYINDSEYNSNVNLNHAFKNTLELCDSNLCFQSIHTVNEENSLNSYGRWEYYQKQTKETGETPLIVTFQDTKPHQNVSNIFGSLRERDGCVGIGFEKCELGLEMNEVFNVDNSVKENGEYVHMKEYIPNTPVHIRKIKPAEDNVSKPHLENLNFAHKNEKQIEYSFQETLCENRMDLKKQVKPCFVRLDVLQGKHNFKVRCLMHNKYECKCIYGSKTKVKYSRLTSERNKLSKKVETKRNKVSKKKETEQYKLSKKRKTERNKPSKKRKTEQNKLSKKRETERTELSKKREKPHRYGTVKSKTLQQKRKKKKISLNCVNGKLSKDNSNNMFTDASTENMHENSDIHSKEQCINISDVRTLNVVSAPQSLKKVSTNVEEEEEIGNVVLVHQSKENLKMKEEMDSEDVLILSESSDFIKKYPVIKIEDINESNEHVFDHNSYTGIFDLSKSLDSDFEEYAESSDELSDNSDEEVDETKNDVIVHKPLKVFADSIIIPLSKELFNKPSEVEAENHEPKPVLICSTPGIGYLHVSEYDGEKIVIEDPVDPKLKHQFSNNGHASNWLDRFFQQNMTCDSGVRLTWPFLHHKISEKAYHFNREILKDKKLIVTDTGVQKLPINDSKELKRFHYRRKLENYAAKLASRITSKYDISTLPLLILLKEATKVIQREKEIHLKLQYELSILNRTHTKLKMKLTTTLKGVESSNITKAMSLLKRSDCDSVMESSQCSHQKRVRRKINRITEHTEKGKECKNLQTNEYSCGTDNLYKENQRFLHISCETAVNILEKKNCSENDKNTIFSPHVNKYGLYKGTASDKTDIQNAKEVQGENTEHCICTTESMNENEDCTVVKECLSNDRLVEDCNSIVKNCANVTTEHTHLLNISKGLSEDHIRHNLYKANLNKIKVWQANRKQTGLCASQGQSTDDIRYNLFKATLKEIKAMQANRSQTGSLAMQRLSADHIRHNLYKVNFNKIKAWQANRLKTDSANLVNQNCSFAKQ